MNPSHVLKLLLNKDGTTDRGVIRISEPSCTIHVVLPVATRFHSKDTVLRTTHPDSTGKPQEFQCSKAYSIVEDMTFDLPVTKPGVFSLTVVKGETRAKKVTFIVDPLIEIGGKMYTSPSLAIQTNYGRCIGHVQDWVTNLQPIAELGYNMIHLPPFQKLGDKSHYSISDQLEVSPELFPADFPANQRWPLLKSTIQRINKELGVVFMSDIVLNHTSPKSPWLAEHPEAGFSVENSPHLKAALFVDEVLKEISDEIAAGKVPDVPPVLSEDVLGKLGEYIKKKLREKNIQQFFIIDIDEAVKQLMEFDNKGLPKPFEMLRMRARNYAPPQRLNILRAKGIADNKLDIYYAVALYKTPGVRAQVMDEFVSALRSINAPGLQHMCSVIQDIVKNVVECARHRFVAKDGERLGAVTKSVPLVDPYFAKVETKDGTKYLASNGWVMNAAPTTDFAAPESEAYLRRQIVVWTDSVKLRYGKGPEDSPFLWDLMTKYVRSVAEVVKALRIDNAHSTPLHVAEYFIKQARSVNESLYVMAELFTSSEEQDIKFINHLGINGFMREGYHRVSPEGLTNLLWTCGGRSVATVDRLDKTSVLTATSQLPGVIFDQTHDNGPVFFDRLITTAVISMSCSPIASTRGYDDFLSFNPSIVNEFRQYPLSKSKPALHTARKILNGLHASMAAQGMDEIMANYHKNIVSVFRCNSQTGEGVWCVAKFPGNETVNEIECPSPIMGLVIEAKVRNFKTNDSKNQIIPSDCDIFINTEIECLETCSISGKNLDLSRFPDGGLVIFKTKAKCDFTSLETAQLEYEFDKRLDRLNFQDFNTLLFRCEEEEQTARKSGTYGFPEDHKCFYAGIQGVITQFDTAASMASPVFENLRQGNWLMDYVCGRCFQIPSLLPVQGALHQASNVISLLPNFMIPKYVDRTLRCLYASCRKRIVQNMSEFVQKGDEFVKDLALASVAFCGAPSVIAPNNRRFFEPSVANYQMSLSAGLPFFSHGFMRSWGRDTFIALRGLFLVTGRFDDAKNHLIVYAACLRHGLIPNLQDGCNNCRYNSRDATWWFLQALQDYVLMSGDDIFQCKVPHLFPTDDQAEYERSIKNSDKRPVRKMCDVVQDIMQRHANGIHFREWGAGEKLDWVMTDNGFNVDIITDWSNGFVLGGNQDNCGTWMDKMGCSKVAKNRGVPATPRDGADIEIIGLLQSTLRFLEDSATNGTYPYKGVDVNGKGFISWRDWSNRIISNFEGWFYVPMNPDHDSQYFIEHSLVSVRGIYKDTVGSSSEFGDYQFRPNLLVAMTVAPELFDPLHAVRCLDLVEKRLLGPIGMKTLDEADWRYRPVYDNSDADTNEDYFTSGGFNYHNGPEWLWPTGYFFRASMRFRRPISDRMLETLAALKRTLRESPAFGLPELTNRDGQPCRDSCTTQAWSVATVLDMLSDYALYTDAETYDWEAEEDLLD